MININLNMVKTGLIRGCLILLAIILNTAFVAGQDRSGVLESIARKLGEYCIRFPREEVYLHTDRSDYISGEDVWFEAYVFDRKSSTVSPESSILYVEVLNFVNRPIVQKRIALKDGMGPGQLTLPDTLSSGNYTLRAYTNWMKNFLPYNCFTRKLNIYNPVSPRSFVRFEVRPAQPVPEPSFPGFDLTVNKSNSQTVELRIITDRNFRTLEGSYCLLLVQTRGSVNFKTTVNLASDSTTAYISRSVLPEGINNIAVFTPGGKLLRNIYIFTPGKQDDLLAVRTNDRAGTRERFSVDLNNENKGKPGSLSISVAPAGTDGFPGISDYMVFGSEFGPLPDDLMKTSPVEMSGAGSDQLLSGLRSNWIDWNSIISGAFPVIRYPKETSLHFIYGRLTGKLTQKPDPDRFLILSVPGKIATFQYAKSDAGGEFDFAIPVDSRLHDLIIQPEEFQRNNTINIESSFSGEYSPLVTASDSLSKRLPDAASAMCVNYQVRKIYGSDEVTSGEIAPVIQEKVKRFYGKPDIELKMDEYIKLPVMQEVFFELMPGVFLKKRKTEYEITIADPVDNRVYPKPPILFVDGVPVDNASIIANLDPELVERIDAVKERYLVGDFLFFGIVNVITRAGDYSSVSLPEYAVRMPYRVTEPVKSFSSPDYLSPEKKQSRIPDLRNTLYWNPELKINPGGGMVAEFWTSDFASDYVINIQGVTADGFPLSVKKQVRVEK